MVSKRKKSKRTKKQQKKTKQISHHQRASFYQNAMQHAVALHQSGNYDQAEVLYKQILLEKPNDPDALNFLGLLNYHVGKIENAVKLIKMSIRYNPHNFGAYSNLGNALKCQGKLDEAFGSFQKAMKAPLVKSDISDDYIDFLNNYMPNTETDCPFVNAQKSLLQINTEFTDTRMIADKTVKQLYQQCLSILVQYKIKIRTNKTQLYRGTISEDNCHRHLKVFNKFRIIPEFCFGCIKVFIEPRNVMELFKLLFVFDKLKLPNDNTRKCIVEVRPGISGTYKGFLYSKSLTEGNEILDILQPILDEKIGKGIPIHLKRGCSEFEAVYPGFSQITDKYNKPTTYNEEWRKHEVYFDKNMPILAPKNTNNFSFNHSGFTLLDIIVMRKWLAYAEKTGDLSYRKIVD